jgi:predicted O-methyltransferase YrrM
MDDSLRSLLRELEIFGRQNDARETERPRRLLNITPDTGEFLAILVLATRAKRVLEIGTSNGYSTLWLADAVRALSGSVVTVDVNPIKVEMARKNFERAALMPWIRQEQMDAGDFLHQLKAEQFDLLFLDSTRWNYVGWWPSIQNAIAPGGLLVVDNATSHPEEMTEFVELVRATRGWRSVVVPIGKGEFVGVKGIVLT